MQSLGVSQLCCRFQALVGPPGRKRVGKFAAQVLREEIRGQGHDVIGQVGDNHLKL